MRPVFTRRALLLPALLLALAASTLGAHAAQLGPAMDLKVTDTDFSLGKADAPVTIVEYASLTCPHCAEFQRAIVPDLKKNYVDTGKVRLVFRDFPLDQLALRAAQMTRCASPLRYFGFLDALFAAQDKWATAADPLAALKRIGKLGGVTDEQFDRCIADKTLEDKVLGSRLEAMRSYDVKATPTVFINGRKVEGAGSFADYDALLKPLAGG